MPQQQLGSLVAALDHERRRVLAARSHWELARAHKPVHGHAVVGGWPTGVEVGPQVRLAEAPSLIDLLDRALDFAGHDVVTLAVKQPDPVTGEVGRIVNELLPPRIPD